jgi:hypothetical protein
MRLSFLASDLLDEDLESKVRLFSTMFRDVSPSEAEKLVRQIAESDPTEKKIYLHWLVRQVKQKAIRLPEDHERVNEVLKTFDKLKRQFPEKDINRYTFHELEAKADQLKGVDVRSKRSIEKEIKAKGAKKVYELGDMYVMEITTPEAAEIYSLGTKWCTSNRETAVEYLDQGPLYVFIKDGEKLAQLHLQSEQLMDVTDQPMEPDASMKAFIRQMPTKSIEEKIGKATYLRERLSNEEEKEIANDPYSAYLYARDVIKDVCGLLWSGENRWPEGEKAILSDPKLTYHYAKYVIKGEWPEGEKVIANDPEWASEYAIYVIGGRWPEGEKAIASDPKSAYQYASFIKDVYGEGRWPMGEKAIANDSYSAYQYAKDVIEGRWPMGEKAIANDPYSAYQYAKDVIEGRWPEGEKAIMSDPGIANKYTNWMATLKSRADAWTRKFLKGEEV